MRIWNDFVIMQFTILKSIPFKVIVKHKVTRITAQSLPFGITGGAGSGSGTTGAIGSGSGAIGAGARGSGLLGGM